MPKVKIVTTAERHAYCSIPYSYSTTILDEGTSVAHYLQKLNKEAANHQCESCEDGDDFFRIVLICVHEEESNGG